MSLEQGKSFYRFYLLPAIKLDSDSLSCSPDNTKSRISLPNYAQSHKRFFWQLFGGLIFASSGTERAINFMASCREARDIFFP